jgi:reactive intermediate/imine deaminase
MKKAIHTFDAPPAIGPYSQAIQVGDLVFISGQIPLNAQTGMLVAGGIEEQTQEVFKNLKSICLAAGGDLKDIIKLTIYLTDLSYFETVNRVMQQNFQVPYPARATLGVASLPRHSLVEIEAIMELIN